MYEEKIIIVRPVSHSINNMRFSKLRVNVAGCGSNSSDYAYGEGKKTVSYSDIFVEWRNACYDVYEQLLPRLLLYMSP